MAAKAARKHASPPPVVDEDDDNSKDNVLFFALKVLPSATTPDICARKILEKSSEDECKLQLGIIKKVKCLNKMLKNKRPMDLFRDHSCSVLYQQILDMQIAQHFANRGWKVIAFATLVPMVSQITLYTAPIFHTRQCNLFFSWTLGQKFHCDMQMSPLTGVFSDENVDQQIGLVEKPTRNMENENDWPINRSLENLNESSSSVESKSSSIDSGKTVVKPVIPVMDSNDVTHLESSFVESSNQDSYLDISFINVKRRLNLSKKEKIDILENNPSSVHSTPVRPVRPNSALRPKLGTSFKKASMSRLEKNLAGQSKSDKPGYITQFLNKWFRTQIDQMSSELELELKSRTESME